MNCNKHLAIISALEFCCRFAGIGLSIEPIAPLRLRIHTHHNFRLYPRISRYLQSVFVRSSIRGIRICAHTTMILACIQLNCKSDHPEIDVCLFVFIAL